MKDWVIYLIALSVLSMTVWNELRQQDKHQQFFSEVETFMHAGGRNTSANGYQLCKRLEALEAEYRHHHEEPYNGVGCEGIYKMTEKQRLEYDFSVKEYHEQ